MAKLVEDLFYVNGKPFIVNGEPFKVTVEQAMESVDKISSIPAEAKSAVKDFIFDNWSELIDSIQNIQFPSDLLERIPDIPYYIDLVWQSLG